MNSLHLVLIPHVSEKAYGQSQYGTYIFKVPLKATKQLITEAVTTQYGVKVDDVRIVVAKGKLKRTYRNGKASEGHRRTTKKAYVTLVEGDRLKIFDEQVEEQK